MNLKERMRDYIKVHGQCSLKQMRLDLAVDGRTAQKPTIELIDEGFIKVIPAEGVLYVVPQAQTQSSARRVIKDEV